MNGHELENDLHDLIEGRLPAERVPVVRAALEKDPSLFRTVERLAADRRGLVELGRATDSAARADRAAAEGTVHEAIARAERESLVQPGPRTRRRRLTPLAAAIGVLVGVGLLAGGFTYLILARESVLRASEIKRQERASTGRIEAVMPEPTEIGKGTALAADPTEPPPVEATPVASLPSWINLESDPNADATVSVWTREATRAIARDRDASIDLVRIAGGALSRIRSGGSSRLSLEEAAALAESHRLRLIVPKGGVDWTRRRAEVFAAARQTSEPAPPDSSPATAPPSGRDEARIAVQVPLDPELAGLRDALGDLQKRLGTANDPGWFELDDPSASDAGALPSLALDDILWWSNEPAAWAPGLTVQVRVIFDTDRE